MADDEVDAFLAHLAFDCERAAEMLANAPLWVWGDLSRLDTATIKLREILHRGQS
jgi:hypothetical protein